MPRVLITAAALSLALIAVTAAAETVDEPDRYVDPTARHPGFTGPCQYAEALNLGGTIYLADPGAHQPRFLRDAVPGPAHATVAEHVPEADACEDELPDGASTYLSPGATLHPVDDWSPIFRLVAVQPSGRLVLYQAAWSTTARTAGDYLDLRDRNAAVSAGPRSFCNQDGCVDYAGAPPMPAERGAGLIEVILASPIDPTAMDLTHQEDVGQFYVEVRFPDDTGVNLVVDCGTMTSTTGIVLALDTVPDALPRYVCEQDNPLDDPPPTMIP